MKQDIIQKANELISKDWVYRGTTHNLKKEGWIFRLGTKKRALGTCRFNTKVIELSEYFIDHSSREMKMWENTIIHEIAHAVSKQYGSRGHDRTWQNIFKSFGGNGNRTSSDAQFGDIIKNPVSKYTNVCPNGHASPSHKKSKRIEQGRISCGKCCDTFNKDYLLKQIKNY